MYVCYRIVFFLLYNNFIPISLYVSIEVVNMGQANLMASDLEMYNEELDTPCAVRSSNLGQELGKFYLLLSLLVLVQKINCISYFRSGQQHFLRQDR